VPAFPLRLLLGFVGAGLLAAGAILVLPEGGGETPPESTLVGVAAAVAAITGLALYAGLRFDLGLPTSIALYAVGYNLLVVLVKFVLGPRALYDASEAGKVTSDLGKDDITVITALGIAALYLLAFWILYRLATRRLERRRRTRGERAWIVVGIVLVLVFLSGLLPALLLMFLLTGGEYVGFVFSSGASLVAGVALAGAVVLARLALTNTAERARAVGDATLLASVFWVGVAYLALYHALWVVYVLVLTSLWPLKVVTSK
jgi:hypothetical protein